MAVNLDAAWKWIAKGVRDHPRAVAAGSAGIALVAAILVVSPFDNSVVHLPRPNGVRPIVFTTPDGALPPGAPRPTVPKYDSAYAGAESAALELVRKSNGRLTRPFRQVRDCAQRPCTVRVVVKADGAVAFDGVAWAEGYIPTGRGEEVVRLRPTKAEADPS